MPEDILGELPGLDKPEGGEKPKSPEGQPSDKPSNEDQLVARAKRAEEALKKKEEELAALKARPSSGEDDIRKELAINRFMVQGYSEEEAKALVETKGNPFVKAGIEAARAKQKVEQAIPSPSKVSATPDAPTKFTKLSRSEQQRIWTEKLDKVAGQKGGV